MASPYSPSTAEAPVLAPAAPRTPPVDDLLLIAGSADGVAADFAAYARRSGRWKVAVLETCRLESLSRDEQRCRVSLVVFLGLNRRDRPVLDAVAERVDLAQVERLCVVSSFRVHLGDRRAIAAEAAALERLRPLAARTVLFRAGHVLSPNSRVCMSMRTWSFLHPLVPARLRSCFIDGDELFTTIDRELHAEHADQRTYSVLGANRSWKSLLASEAQGGLLRRGLALGAKAASLLGLGQLAGLVVDHCGTLYPKSIRELLELYNPYSYQRVKVVGYNNGVVHFGHSYPGKTIVSTVRCNATARVKGTVGTFDAGVTLRQAIAVADAAGQEFQVLPNYSYVSLGTAFFVPIHGSASQCATLGETIERVLLYDPAADRVYSAARDDPAFHEAIYNQQADLLLLRLRVRLKEKSHYYRKHTRLAKATSQQVLDLLRDRQAANVEIRKARAADEEIDVYQYFARPTADPAAAPFPRDRIGKLWDRLEANPLTSVLFHWLVRRFGFHVELFLTPEEFRLFWETHRRLPLAKIQLRYIRRDGFPHSPFGRHDCVSADLFLWRKHRPAFEAYLKENFCAVQFNPGKHSA